jgi:hypothetical protein
MKGDEAMAKELKIPKFSSEKEESKWWFEHRDELERAFLRAAQEGRLKQGPEILRRLGLAEQTHLVARGRRSPLPTRSITIRLPVADIDRAAAIARERGVGYQTVIKTLLHEALNRETALKR